MLGKPVQVPLYSSRPTIAVGIVNFMTILPADSQRLSGRRAQIGQVAVLSAPERLGWKVGLPPQSHGAIRGVWDDR